MKTFVLLISLLTSNTGIVTQVESNYVSNEKILISAVSSSGTISKSYESVTSSYKIGYKLVSIPNAYQSDRDYFTFFKITFPRYFQFNSGKLKLYKQSGSISALETYYYLSDLDYSSTNYIYSGSLPVCNSTTDLFEINITSAIQSAYSSNQNYFYVRIGRSYSGGYGEFYSSEDLYFCPTIELTYNSTTADNTYGNATSYEPINFGNISDTENQQKLIKNCYFYAIDYLSGNASEPGFSNYGLNETYTDSVLSSSVESMILNSFKYNVCFRKIESYLSPIFSNERRIAYKLVINDSTNKVIGYHFMKQHSNGYWSDKYPNDRTYYWETLDPSTVNNPGSSGRHFSPTRYFAISK